MAGMERRPRPAPMLAPGEGERVEARGSVMHFKATGRATGGRFSLMERTLPAGGRMPPPHRHPGMDEAYYVLRGDVHFEIEGKESSGAPGSFLLVPSGVAHTFGNRSPLEATLLVLHAPALDDYFRDLERLWSGPEAPSRGREEELMARHGMLPA